MSINLHYRPAAPLGHFVQTIWYYEGYTQPHAFERLMPDGTMGIVVNLDEDHIRIYNREDTTRFERLSPAIAMGAHDEFFVIDTAQQHRVLGVQFFPGGAFPFLKMPADALAGLHVDLDPAIQQRLLECPTPRARCCCMESALLASANGRLELRPHIAFAVRQLECRRTVSEVLAQTGFTARRFTDEFRTTVGLPPKTYSRVRRFQSALRTIARTREPDWAEIALSCGYYDQAHFNHDFRAFSGINPSTYLAKVTPHLNHVPM